MFGTDPAQPYWKVHNGIARPWTPSASGHKGCMVLLVGGFLLVALLPLLVAVIALLT